ncbi:hypothetical protein K2173_000024 [Erythroxylum novogranatense]|uniref:Protein kinase domain-containing protein n=1 Tax=Erythroxylum novogranatense TaxID=1862640 RepID=A0AAV8SP11_9ROSI|nr:hypothetical protein K2173_000024 [Erythroxylum novogranatense]
MLPFKLFLSFVLASVFAQSLDPTLSDDVFGLIVFKAGLQDPDSKLISWSEDDDTPCYWVGVTCDPLSHRVTKVVLDGFSLSGHIGRGLLRLQFLQVLSLSSNNFTGTINPDLVRLGGLQVVDLSGNSLSGTIPDDFFRQCGSLRSVSFARNNLTGQIPDSLSSCLALSTVNFSSNQLTGELPPGLWSLRGLQYLDLSDNFLEGVVPEGIANLYDLRLINMQQNRFSGSVPADIGRCLSLKQVDFSENSLSGSLPESLQKLSACNSLRLGRNSLTGELPGWIGELKNLETLDFSSNRFFGRIPDSLGSLYSLKELNLSMNQFVGGLPDSFANCVDLMSIDVSQNRLSGHIPSWIFKMSLRSVSLSGNKLSGTLKYPSVTSMTASLGGLQVLDLSSNALSGEIPHNIGVLSGLLLLNISKNQLLGSIPSSIGELKAMQVLDLSNNRLNGPIPSEIGAAVSLLELRLENNVMTGKIPTEIKNCSSLTSLILSHNNLSGSIPAAIANLSSLQHVDLSFNNLSGSLPKELTNLSHMLSFNISHNSLEGELPLGGFFNTISPSSVSDNPSLCGSVVNRSCPSVHPKPIVLNPNSSGSSHGSSLSQRHQKIVLSISALIAIGAAALIAIGVIAVTLLNIHVQSSRSHSPAAITLSGGEDFSCSPTNDPNYGKLVMFSGDADFVAGTNALLNKDCEIGRGGFGVVYRTMLRDGRSVAIKKLTVSSLIKSQEEFEREVKKLGKIRHHNLVALEGYYWTPSLQLLIYEYIPSGSLYKHLHDVPGTNCLYWRQRFNIVLGMAKGLAHLHRANFIHYNLKSTNILIDDFGEPKVGDFGLARLLPMLDRCILSSKIQSALGYMAPEFACKTVKITEKCDVYGFGVLVLEVVTGKRPVEYMEDDVVVLCDLVRGALEDGRVEECIDGRLRGNFPADEAIPVIKLGLICASQVPSNRPDMEEVVNILELIQCPAEGQEDME